MPDDMTFGDCIGLGTHFDQGESMTHLEGLVDLGVRWVRDYESWPAVELKPGTYKFSPRFQERLAFYKNHGIGVCYGLWYGNVKSYPDDPYNAEAYGRYAAAVARMLKEAGVQFVLEIWNEPHNFFLRSYFGGKWNAAPPSPWVDHYVQMVHAAIEGAKSLDPKVKLLIDEDVWVAHYWFLEKGLPRKLDGVAIHPYVQGSSPGPEVTSFGPDFGGHQPFIVVDEDRSYSSAIRRLREQYTKKLGYRPEIWVTEWGYRLPVIGSEIQHEVPTEDMAAAFLQRLYIISVANGARCVMWHVSQDIGDGPYGLWRNDQTKRLTYDAFKEMSRQLGDLCLIKQVAGANHSATGVQAFLFKGPKGYKLVAWNIEGPQKVTLASRTTLPMRITDKFGKPAESESCGRAVEFGLDGPMIIQLSRSPLYVTGVGGDVAVEVYGNGDH